MKIEFRKIPNTQKEFSVSCASVTLEGIFCRISSKLVKIDSNLAGKIEMDCARCGREESIEVNEELSLLVSDGVFNDDNSEELVIEIENHTIDFDEIVQSEISSIQSDYYICKDCLKNDNEIEQEI